MGAANKIETKETGLSIPAIQESQWPEIYEGGDYLQEFIEKVRNEVTGEVPDLSTKKGRARVASLASKVSSAKAAVEKPGRDYLRSVKAKVKPIEANLREFVASMNALRDEVRGPLNEWEKEQAKIKADIENRIASIKQLTSDVNGLDSSELKHCIAESESIVIDESFGELQGEAATTLILTQKTLRDALAKREAYEAEQAALEKQRKEQEAERQRLKLAKIEQEAKEKAQLEAEAKVKAEQEAAQKREIEARIAQEKAEREAAEAKQREERLKLEAEERAKQAAIDAAEAERKRIAEEQAAIEAEQRRREEDEAHRGHINRCALADLVALGLDESTAKTALIGIIQGKVSNVAISY